MEGRTDKANELYGRAGIGLRKEAKASAKTADLARRHGVWEPIIYNTTSGNLFYDVGGSGVRYAAVLVANLNGSPDLSYPDIQIIA